jgi:hypothetical protein
MVQILAGENELLALSFFFLGSLSLTTKRNTHEKEDLPPTLLLQLALEEYDTSFAREEVVGHFSRFVMGIRHITTQS